MSVADTHLMEAEAETYSEVDEELLEGDGTVVGEFTAEQEGDGLHVRMHDWEKEVFDEAVNAADSKRLEERWSRVQQNLEENKSEEVNLTEGDDRLRGFGGGMLNVVKGEDSIKLYGPRRDFGPISHKGMFDISAGRTQAEGELDNWIGTVKEEFDIEEDYIEWLEENDNKLEKSEENWEELLHREGVEEVVFTRQSEDENILYLPEFGEEDLDFKVQKAALQEFIKAKQGWQSFGMEEKSHLNGKEFKVETYEAETVSSENAAKVTLEDFNGEDIEFEAGLIPETETSSLEGFKLNIIDEAQLSDDYAPQDTETAAVGGDFVHFDRKTYEIEISSDGVEINIYQGGKQKGSCSVEEYLEEMKQDFRSELESRVESEEELSRLNSLGTDIQESRYGDLEALQTMLKEPERLAEYGLKEVWSDLSEMGDGYDNITELQEDLEKTVELKEDLGEAYASQYGTVKVIESLRSLEDEFGEYEESIGQLADQLESPASPHEDLPWTGA